MFVSLTDIEAAYLRALIGVDLFKINIESDVDGYLAKRLGDLRLRLTPDGGDPNEV